MTDHTWQYYVAQAKDTLQRLKLAPVPDEEAPDAIGHINHIRAMAQGLVTALKTETPDNAVGKEYKLERAGSYQRSYNLQGIISSALHADGFTIDNPDDVLVAMVNEGVLKISTWSALQKFCERYDIPIKEVHHEIQDGDPSGAMVGKVWKTRPPNVTAVTKEQT